MRNRVDSIKAVARILAAIAVLAGLSACGGGDDDGDDDKPSVSIDELYGETSRTWRLTEGKRIVSVADTSSQETPLSTIADCDLDDAHVFSAPNAAFSYQQVEGAAPCFEENANGDVLYEQEYALNEDAQYIVLNGGALADFLVADTLMIEELTAERIVLYDEFTQGAGEQTVTNRTELILLPDPQ